MGRLIFAEDIKARAREEAVAMGEPWKSNFAPMVEWLVDKTFTAYDPEKVVEQLEEETNCPNCSMYCADASIGGFDEMRKQAIEIVKKGGAE